MAKLSTVDAAANRLFTLHRPPVHLPILLEEKNGPRFLVGSPGMAESFSPYRGDFFFFFSWSCGGGGGVCVLG